MFSLQQHQEHVPFPTEMWPVCLNVGRSSRTPFLASFWASFSSQAPTCTGSFAPATPSPQCSWCHWFLVIRSPLNHHLLTSLRTQAQSSHLDSLHHTAHWLIFSCYFVYCLSRLQPFMLSSGASSWEQGPCLGGLPL